MDPRLLRQVVNQGLKDEAVNSEIFVRNLVKARMGLDKEITKDPSLLGKANFAKVLDEYIDEAQKQINEEFFGSLGDTLTHGMNQGKYIVGDAAKIEKGSDFWGWQPTLPVGAIGIEQAKMADLIQKTSSQLKEKILRTTQTGLAGGMSLKEIQNQILGVGLKGMKGRDGVWRSATSRAEMQARTITNELLNRGALMTYNQVDKIVPELNLVKVWQTVSDRRTSPICRALAGKVVGLNEEFSGGGWTGSHPPSHPNCRSRVTCLSGEWAKEFGDRFKGLQSGSSNPQNPSLSGGWPVPVTNLVDPKTAIKNLVSPRVAPANLAPVKIPDTPPKTYLEALERADLKYSEDFKKLDEAIKLLAEDKELREYNIALLKADRAMRKIAGDKTKAIEFFNLDNLKDELLGKIDDRQNKLKENLLSKAQQLRKKMVSQGDEALALIKANGTILEGDLPFIDARGGRFYQDNLRDLHRISNNRVNDLEVLIIEDSRAWAAKKGVQYTGDPDLRGRINVGSKYTEGGQKTTLWHEFGHHIEYSTKEIQDIANEFVRAKAHTQSPQRLSRITGNPDFGDNEVAYPGDFLSPYVGKIYNDGSTEVISMGLQQFADLDDMVQFYQNHPDHFRLILGIL